MTITDAQVEEFAAECLKSLAPHPYSLCTSCLAVVADDREDRHADVHWSLGWRPGVAVTA